MTSTSVFPAPSPAGADGGSAEVTLNRHMRRALAKNPAAVAGGGQGGSRVSRHSFLGALAAGGALAAAGPAMAATARPASPPAGLSLAPPSFTAISSQLQFGQPVDISAGWDGTLWALDATGAPQLYDPMTDTWAPQDDGVDAVAAFGVPGVIYYFRGDSYVSVIGGTNQVHGPPTPIATTWPNLPKSFTQGVHGAANVNGELYLFRGGLYVVARTSGPAAVPDKLTDLAGWPQTPAWKDGVIDAVSSDAGGRDPIVELYRDDEVMLVDMVKRQVQGPPSPLSDTASWRGHVPADWVAGGIDAGYYYISSGTTSTALYRGIATIFFHAADQGIAVPQYLPTVFHGWPATWNPVLADAPGGRAGALSAAASDGTVLQNRGAGWAALSALPGGGKALSVSAGRDGVVYAATTAALHRLEGTTWSPGVTPGGQLAQVAVGDASKVWARDASNTVYRLNDAGTGFTPATLLGAASHIAANADGTVWHCNEGPSAYRFISEGTQAPQAISLGEGSSAVRKVASTGFGNSFCLVGPPGTGSAAGGGQLFSYQSNYQFKTSQSYNAVGFGTIAEGAGMIFLVVDESKVGQTGSAVVGLDTQTGDQRFLWSPGVSGPNVTLTNPVYDPANQVLYVGTSSGVLHALDVRTQKPVWSYQVPGGARIDAAPALAGSSLCFGDSNGYLYLIDTGQAAAAAPAAPAPAWRKARPGPPAPSTLAPHVATPLIQNGEAIFVTWYIGGAFSLIAVPRLSLDTGEPSHPVLFERLIAEAGASFVPAPPVAGIVKGSSGTTPVIFVNGYNRIYAISGLDNGTWRSLAYQLDGDSHFTSGMAFGNGVLWAGDSIGRLFGLSGLSMLPVAGTPVQPHPADAILTTPLVYTDSAGATSVLFGAVGPASTELWVFDPSRPAGEANPVSVSTGQTRVSQLSASITNGVVYAAGATYWDPAQTAAGQVFAIYIDRATQALRDFIVESQLMQDFDEPPAGQTQPPAFARYQTHLTVVDDLKGPRAFEAVKVWADRATSVSINGGAPVSIGPGDDEFAAAQTGADGAITLVTGSVAGDGSDEADVFASPLRVWAAFMDLYERVAVFPDREFHGRLAAAQAITDANNPGYDNPAVVNLQTAQNYSGATLFTSAEQNSGQPKAVADAIQAMVKSVPISADGQAPAAPAPGPVHLKPPPLGAPPGRYLAYPALPGGAFSLVNVAANQGAVVAAPTGLQFASNDNDTAAPAFSVLSHADATMAIDALPGQDFTHSGLVGASLLGNGFSDFWNFIKHAAATITHVVVSIGKEIYAGIRFIINGVALVFRHPLQFLDDVVAVIGTFFTKLAKLVKNVVEAIGILFHFDEIIKTHRLLRDELLKQICGDPVHPDDYPGYANLLGNIAQPAIDGFFKPGEDAIKSDLDTFKKSLTPSQKISTLPGAGSTSTTLFMVAPVNSSAPASSHSVACMWAMHKTQAGQQQASYSGGSTAAAPPSLPQKLQDFINKFAGRLTGDGDLRATAEDVKSDIDGLFSGTSFTQFAEEGLAAVVDLVALVLEGVLAVGNAFIDGILKVCADLITYLFDSSTGLLTQKIQIPVISALYEHFFGEDLTILNLVMLVAAIPVTILYRALSGRYPSQDLQTPAGLLRGVNLEARRNVFGILGGIATCFWGILRAFSDGAKALQASGEEVPDVTVFTVAGTCMAFVVAVANFPKYLSSSPPADNYITWGMSFGPLTASMITLAAGGQILGVLSAVVLMLCSVGIIAVAAIQFSNKKAPTKIDTVRFAATMMRSIPGSVNPLKYAPFVGLVVPIVDIFGCWGSAGASFAATAFAWDTQVK
jgi:hypothetical protein